jgi:hypothetical protein
MATIQFSEAQKQRAIVHTFPHGAQIIEQLDDNDKPCTQTPYDGNALYQMTTDSGKKVVLTGEEWTSLAAQWRQYRNT